MRALIKEPSSSQKDLTLIKLLKFQYQNLVDSMVLLESHSRTPALLVNAENINLWEMEQHVGQSHDWIVSERLSRYWSIFDFSKSRNVYSLQIMICNNTYS